MLHFLLLYLLVGLCVAAGAVFINSRLEEPENPQAIVLGAVFGWPGTIAVLLYVFVQAVKEE